jgi:hypothetical protein
MIVNGTEGSSTQAPSTWQSDKRTRTEDEGGAEFARQLNTPRLH